MNGRSYYNEIDPYAAQWLRNLIAAGLIAPGDVDERSIVDVSAGDLIGYTQCHFFAGIGGWSLALRLAGWPDDRSVWTGSCPCQPFSAAGAGKAADDSRHLWPAWFPLIAERRPPVVFGEQVEAAIGWGWLDAVYADLEGEGYACGASVLPACGIGAPHIRQRLWFVADADGGNAGAERSQRSGQHGQRAQDGRTGLMADSDSARRRARRSGEASSGRDTARIEPAGLRIAGELADTAGRRQREFGNAARSRSGGHDDSGIELGVVGDTDRGGEHRGSGEERCASSSHEREVEGCLGERLRSVDIGAGANGALDHAADARRSHAREHDGGSPSRAARSFEPSASGFWHDAEWIACTDGKSRPVGPGSFPLGHGIPRRTSKLRAYGNAIVPQIAAEFIRAFLETYRVNA